MDIMLVLNINPQLEEDLVDYLLGFEGVEGFTSIPVRGHGGGEGLSLAEQVSGRRKRVRIELLLSPAVSEQLIQGLQAAVGGDIVWWEQPLIRSGRV